MKQLFIKLGLVAILVGAGGVLYSQFGEYASLDYIKTQQQAFQDYYAENKAVVLTAFFVG